MADMGGFVWYNYTPSMAAAVIMCIVFFAASFFHIFMVIKHKTWYFIPFIIGCLCKSFRINFTLPSIPSMMTNNFSRKLVEAVGYIGRILSSAQAPDFTENPYVLQSTLLLLGPTFLTASIYMVLGRLIISLQAQHHALIKPKWLTKVFVVGDILSFFIQVSGDGLLMTAKTVDLMNLANNIVVAGLVVQIAFFAFFLLVAVIFNKRIVNSPTGISKSMATPWDKLIHVLYASSVLVLIRYIYRVAEYVQGTTGTLQQKEMWLYIFDALPMALVVLAYCAFHPSRVVNTESLQRAQLYSEIGMEEMGYESRAQINKH